MPDYDEFEKESPLHRHVFKYNGMPLQYAISGDKKKSMLEYKRHLVLDDFLKTEIVPKTRYIEEWGEPNSEQRIKKMIQHINYFYIESAKNEKCRRQSIEDVKYLIKKYLTEYLDKDSLMRYFAQNKDLIRRVNLLA